MKSLALERHTKRALALLIWVITAGGAFFTLSALPTPIYAWQQTTDALGAGTFDYANQLGFAIATLGFWAVFIWLVITASLAIMSWIPGRLGALGHHASLALTPAIARRAVTAMLGVGLIIGGPAASYAADTGTSVGSSIQQPHYDLDWPIGQPTTSYNLDWPIDPAVPPTSSHTTHTIAENETLWGIAETYLPAGVTDAQIAQAWPNWWQANRDLIGEDPNHLTPGQQLQAPDPR